MSGNEILKGHFVVATPEVDSGIFFRTVVLICEHNANGTLGLIINKTLDISLPGELLEIGEIQNPKLMVCTSGPVQTNQLMLLHDSDSGPENHTLKICDQVFLGGDLEFLQASASDTQGPAIKLCFGYAGWGTGQLEREFINGQWFIYPASAKHVFETPPDKLWRTLLREMGGRYASLSMIPDNLAFN